MNTNLSGKRFFRAPYVFFSSKQCHSAIRWTISCGALVQIRKIIFFLSFTQKGTSTVCTCPTWRRSTSLNIERISNFYSTHSHYFTHFIFPPCSIHFTRIFKACFTIFSRGFTFYFSLIRFIHFWDLKKKIFIIIFLKKNILALEKVASSFLWKASSLLWIAFLYKQLQGVKQLSVL